MKFLLLLFFLITLIGCSKPAEWNSDLSKVKEYFDNEFQIEKAIWQKNILNEERNSIPGPQATSFKGIIKLSGTSFNFKRGDKINLGQKLDSLPSSWNFLIKNDFYFLEALSKKYSKVDGNCIIAFAPSVKVIYFEVNSNFVSTRRERRIPK